MINLMDFLLFYTRETIFLNPCMLFYTPTYFCKEVYSERNEFAPKGSKRQFLTKLSSDYISILFKRNALQYFIILRSFKLRSAGLDQTLHSNVCKCSFIKTLGISGSFFSDQLTNCVDCISNFTSGFRCATSSCRFRGCRRYGCYCYITAHRHFTDRAAFAGYIN